jgi:hypothetical protein
MPIVDYPFKAQGVFSIPSPILPVLITNPHNGANFRTWGLVDTGAVATVIPGFIARNIGHNVENVATSSGDCAGGQITVYPHTCNIDILSMNSNGNVNENDIIIRIPPCKMGVINDCQCVLLGVSDFLKKYILKIDYPRKIFSICLPKLSQQKNKLMRKRR